MRYPKIFTACAFLTALFIRPGSVHAQCQAAFNGTVYWVTTNADSGPGSLRQAITDANTAAIGGTIEINGPWTSFSILSQLPAVTCDSLVIFPALVPVTIDGGGFVPEPGVQFAVETSCLGSLVSGSNFVPAIFMVTNTNDIGPGSLRDAVRNSNFSASADEIRFDIPGVPPHLIQLTYELPNIYRPLLIDGNSQPANGYSGFAPKIEIAGVGNSFDGFVFNYASAPYQYNASLYGLYLHDFATAIYTSRCNTFTLGQYLSINVISGNTNGVSFNSDQFDNIVNNYIGVAPDGFVAQPNNYGISITGLPAGNYLAEYNVISGNLHSGMLIYPGTRNVLIKSNYIGTDRLAGFAIPNEVYGINCSGNQVTIGGTQPGTANIFSGNGIFSSVPDKAALALFGDSCIVIGNRFGTDLTGTDTIPNVDCAAVLVNGSYNRIGGPMAAERNYMVASKFGVNGFLGQRNTIQNNYIGTTINGGNFPNETGINLGSDSTYITLNRIINNITGIQFGTTASGNTVIMNQVYNNTMNGIMNQGILNTFTQNSTFNNGNKAILNYQNANNGIQPPVITFCSIDSITGTSLPGAQVEIFYNQSNNSNPQGQTLFASVTALPSGDWKYINSILNPGNVTATQTDDDGNTSEFSDLFLFSPDNVWPGDCNYDLTADNLDFVYLGMAYGNSGPVRPGASLTWNPQPASDWVTGFSSGLNHKHADTNGDGMVDLQDTAAILLNYGFTHPFRLAPEIAASPVYDFYVRAQMDTIAPGANAVFDIYAGTPAAPVDSLYGLAWNFVWDANLVYGNAIQHNYGVSALGTWHTNMESFVKPNYAAGGAALALTRIDQVDATQLQGIIGQVTFTTSPAIATPSLLILAPITVRARKISGEPVYFTTKTDTVVIDPNFTGLTEPAQPIVDVYPNPVHDVLNVSSNAQMLLHISLSDPEGRAVIHTAAHTHNYQLNLSGLHSGVYFLETLLQDGTRARKRIVVER